MSGKGETTRNTIIDESLQLFSVKGYYNTSINDIMKATGLTKGGLYAHFASKEEIWYAVYDRAMKIWQGIVFRNLQEIPDPLERIRRLIVNDLKNYLGANTFKGGCFFLNMVVELSGQSPAMSGHILKGFVKFARLIRSWLTEAAEKGMMKKDLNLKETANFIVVTLNGAAALYTANRDVSMLNQTIDQLRFYLDLLRK